MVDHFLFKKHQMFIVCCPTKMVIYTLGLNFLLVI